MKASYHNDRKRGNARHNDRDFDTEKALHIDSERTKDNLYVCVYPGMNFLDAEKKFYKENFSDYVKDVNERRRKSKHKGNKTTEDLRRGKYTCPEESILQIGKMDDYPENAGELLKTLFAEMQRYSNEISHLHCKILNAAIHMDEGTPHLHMRRVWVYEENGIKKIGQEESLKRAGIELPFPDRPLSPSNNRKVTYDRMMRQKMYELCKEYGLEINITPDEHNREYMTKEEYVNAVIMDAREKAQERREAKGLEG